MITQEQVRGLFDYDPVTGLLTFKYSCGKAKKGEVVGTPLTNGYLRTFIKGKSYYLHRIAFLHYHGYLPIKIDHENQVKTDNRISNLRECTDSQNQGNIGKKSHNTTGLRGVFAHQGKWMVRIAGKYVGVYDCKYLAAIAYDEAAVSRYGEFADTNFPAFFRRPK